MEPPGSFEQKVPGSRSQHINHRGVIDLVRTQNFPKT